MKKIFGALLICGLLTVPMAQAAKTKAPKVHQSKQAQRQAKKQARVAKKENAKARKQVQRQAARQAKDRKSV